MTRPARFSLGRNAPNPFTAGTVIHFAVPVPSHVRLQLYDAMGRRVAVLVNRRIEPGHHSVSWNGADDRGRRLANGLYFLRMTAGQGFQQVRRIVLAP